ncbi:hypothetical protein ACQP25_18555 [Microtetraspora malaysiensis]|uniref:hypothetical protein n=1 Tax=Microtetraspora malaysiensis TaxID=161358 RepID=UPI003D93E089
MCPTPAIRSGAAQSRLLYRCAESLYRYALDAGDGYAARLLVELLDREGRVEEARWLRWFGLPADD